MTSHDDPLILLRQNLPTNGTVPVASGAANAPEVPLPQATHLLFRASRTSLPLTTPTRFAPSSSSPTDLRSIYFAWLNREVAIPEYNAAAQRLNEQLGGAATVRNLSFLERLDLVTWLEGSSEESEFIKFPGGGAAVAQAVEPSKVAADMGVGGSKEPVDPKLAKVYDGERRIGNRNTVLRGSKPTDFSGLRATVATMMSKRPQHPSTSSVPQAPPNKPTRRPDPIILLSPSASSILRMANARTFLEEGRFQQVDGPDPGTNILHITRKMPSIDPSRPLRFILAETTEQFKPEYWNRLVAVFTTGQTWQFRPYKWSNPIELFQHVQGVYVGWTGEVVPELVRTWQSQRFLVTAVDRWRNADESTSVKETAKVRDAECAELIWKAIEENMLAKGWRKDAAPTRI